MSRSTSGSRLYVLDAASLGGADHRTPLFVTQDGSNVRFSDDGVATWRDPAGTRWILTEIEQRCCGVQDGRQGRRTGSRTRMDVAANADRRARRSSSTASCSRSPAADVGANAVLYALDPATGKELWNSGTTITSTASAGMSAGTGQVYVVTADNTVYAFGIPLAIN